jgi:hypothetical protein
MAFEPSDFMNKNCLFHDFPSRARTRGVAPQEKLTT